jgi:hypothetical protein
MLFIYKSDLNLDKRTQDNKTDIQLTCTFTVGSNN